MKRFPVALTILIRHIPAKMMIRNAFWARHRQSIPGTAIFLPQNFMWHKPKELVIIPGADHVDLYDNRNKIPFDKLEQFFRENLR